MKSYFLITVVLITAFCLNMNFAFAQEGESVELVTYYPAPYGDYDELTAYSLDILDETTGNQVITLTNAGNVVANGDVTAANTVFGTDITATNSISGTNITAASSVSGTNITATNSISGTNITAGASIRVNRTDNLPFLSIGPSGNDYRLRIDSNKIQFFDKTAWRDLISQPGGGGTGDTPIPRWNGTRLYFVDSTGARLGPEVDLKGTAGGRGATGAKGDPGISGQILTRTGTVTMGKTTNQMAKIIFSCNPPWQIIAVNQCDIKQTYPAVTTAIYGGRSWWNSTATTLTANATAASYRGRGTGNIPPQYFSLSATYSVTIQER